MTDEELRGHFAQYGEIQDSVVSALKRAFGTGPVRGLAVRLQCKGLGGLCLC